MQNEARTSGGLDRFSRGDDAQRNSPFVCPGSSQAVTPAVHLARLNASWPTCDQCEWRHHTEGLAIRTILDTERIRDYRLNGIRRTEFGIRGQYINDMDRRTAGDLARIFCSCLNERPAAESAAADVLKSERSTAASGLRVFSVAGSSSKAEIQPTFASLAPVVAGYDGRSSSPDIFMGVTSAVREFGLPLIDIGRCTAASILEAVRSFPESSGGILITGAGMLPSWTGLDAFDPAGHPVPVVWKDFGVGLQYVSSGEPPLQRANDVENTVQRDDVRDHVVEEMLRRVRGDSDASGISIRRETSTLRLELPSPQERLCWSRRLSRQSGTHQVIDFEIRYRQWLSRWYPQHSELRILVRSDDSLIRQRLAWLSEQTGLEIVCRSAREVADLPSCRMSITLQEDDREFSVANGYGEIIPAERLATQLNDAIRSQASHVTAHADAASGRFWLTDAARPGSATTTEHIRDGLAVLGLLVRLTETGRLSLHQ